MTEIRKFGFRGNPGAEEAEFFSQNGYLYVTGFYDQQMDVGPVQEGVYKLIGLVASNAGISLNRREFSPDSFDDGLSYLLEHHRPLVSVIYDAVKKLPDYVRTATLAKHDTYCKVMLNTELVGFASRGYGLRMDNPNEDEYSTQAHQDYVSQLSSQNAVVTWSPLRYVSSDMGPMTIYPKSHRDGVFPIKKESDGSRGLVIDDLDAKLSRYPSATPEVDVGDCLFLHFLTLHESGKNRSAKTRWAMLSRFFDFNHPSGRAISWKGGLQEGNSFEKIHPEMTVAGN